VVKNYTASGNYYWVLANVTPDYDSKNKLEGYFSVRRPPGRRGNRHSHLRPHVPAGKHHEQGKAPDASMEWLLAELDKQGHSYESFVLSLLDPHLSTGKCLMARRSNSPFLRTRLGFWLIGFNTHHLHRTGILLLPDSWRLAVEVFLVLLSLLLST
jgi:hypothetical protein